MDHKNESIQVPLDDYGYTLQKIMKYGKDSLLKFVVIWLSR